MNLKINQKNLRHQVYSKIKFLISEGALKPGEKILQEKMAKNLVVSRIPLIQALSALQNEMLIEYQARKGFFVRKISQKEFYDLLEIRGSLEGLAVKKISENLNQTIKKQLLNFLKDFEIFSMKNDIKEYFNLDKKFHYYLIKTSGNSYLLHINNSFNILLLTYTKEFRTKIEESMSYHRKIIKSIINKESEKASMLIIEHLNAVKKYF